MAAIAGLRRLPLPRPPFTAGAARRSIAVRQRLHSLHTCGLAVRAESAAQRGGPSGQTGRGCTRVFASGVSVLEEPAKTPEPEVSGDALGEEFSWTQRWYPVGPEDDMDRMAPYPFELLGRKVVLWYSTAEKRWSCFEDRCPHRLAPLSEGRIDPESSCLQCSYHAWSFRADGTCTHIPQLPPGEAFAKATSNARSRPAVFPVQVAQGLLFLWADPASPDKALHTPPPITPGMDGPDWNAVANFRDLSYGWDTGMENLVDPGHVPVAHHNVNGGLMGKRTDAKPLGLEVLELGTWGFRGRLPKEGGDATSHVFEAPARFTYDFQARKKKEWRGIVTTYCTPMAPGRCRIIVVNARNFMVALSAGPRWYQILPRWVEHQLMLNLLDGDASLLHLQERELRSRGDEQAKEWPRAFFMPAASDRYVSAFRSWLTRFAGGSPAWHAGTDARLPPPSDREAVLDRYHQHTEKCLACQGAMIGFQKAQTVLYMVSFLFLAAAIVFRDKSPAYFLIPAAAAALVGRWLSSWVQGFVYKGYDHAHS